MISKELIEIFNRAAGLARDGKFEESLAEYDRIINPSKDDIENNKKNKVVMTGEFLGVAIMRKAWVLMDLKRYSQAKKVLADKVLDACLGQFDMVTLYDYFFSFGSTLGELGDIKGMDDKYSRALRIASEELSDSAKCFQCWSNLMSYALRAEDWEYLERESQNARGFALNTSDTVLKVKADWHHVQALAGLGRDLEAKEEAEVLVAFLNGIGAGDAARDIEIFVGSLETKKKVSTTKKAKTKKGKKKG